MADRTALYSRHTAAGARMFEFGGWEMPLWYSSIKDEHLAVRGSVGLFDVSHMGKILVRGAGADLEKLVTRSLLKRPSGKCIYTLLLDDGGHIIDDIIVLKVSQDCHFVVCNASMRKKVLRWMVERAGSLVFVDMTTECSCIAVQGPKASALIEKIAGPSATALGRYHGAFTILRFPHALREGNALFDWSKPISEVKEGDSNGIPAIVTRTGYTGEDGFELFTSAADAGYIWDGLLKTGDAFPVQPAGLGARDTLRLEMCYLLSGHDFDGTQTPLQAGARFAIDWDHEFIGKEPLDAQKAEDYARIAAFESVGKGIPREGYRLLSGAGEEIGRSTSGTMSPSLNIGIGMGYLPARHSTPGTKIFYKVGTRNVEAKIIERPFLKK